MNRAASLLLLFAAIYIVGWQSDGRFFMALQVFSMSLIGLSSVLGLLSGRVIRISPSPIELIFAGSFVLATISAVLLADPLSALYGLLFSTMLVAIGHLVREWTLPQILGLFRSVYLGLLVTTLVVQPQEFWSSLNGTVDRETGLVRFSPLGMHPNLSGLVYGGGVLLFLQPLAATGRRRMKTLSLLAAIFCFCIVMAASARAGLLALGVSGAVGASAFALHGSWRARAVLLAGFIGAALILFMHSDQVSDYLTVMLDLDSSTRGFDSGATGRTDLWRQGVALILSDPTTLIFGRGVRSASPDNIGFSVESSYVTMVLELGVVFAAIIVFRMIQLAGRMLALSRGETGDKFVYLFSGVLLIFALVQSVFNRYLLALGNPYSLLILFLCLRSEIEIRSVMNNKTRRRIQNDVRLQTGEATK